MRSSQYVRSLRTLSQGSAIILLGGILSACSSSMTRFDDVLTTGSVLTDNQRSIVNKPVDQPYPESAPAPSTPVGNASGSQTPTYTSGIKVAKPQPLAPPVNAQPLPPSSGIKVVQPTYTAPTPPTPPAAVEAKTSKPIILAPRSTGKKPLSLTGSDTMATGSIVREVPKAIPPVSAAKPKAAGWSGAGGSKVTVKPGETLYNLSRRYGVPVRDIMRANGMTNASALTAGKQIMIPAYTYDKSAKVSAPDSDPMTKAARATTGFKGEVRNGSVAVPRVRVAEPKVAVTPKPVTPIVKAPSVKPETQTKKLASGNEHIVKSGDTLYSISRKYGVSNRALRDANGLTGSNIRLGQKLRIPGGTPKAASKPGTVPKAIVEAVKKPERITTGSVPKQTDQNAAPSVKKQAAVPEKTVTIAKRSTEKVETPSQTGSTSFRWPTNGRVIAKFGERVNGNSNDGIDISVPVGTPVKAAENGTVIYSGSELADFGNLILVSHSGGWVSAYAHASKNNVKRGDTVKRGQVIAISGKSGNASRPKLHFELRKDSTPVNPLKHLGK